MHCGSKLYNHQLCSRFIGYIHLINNIMSHSVIHYISLLYFLHSLSFDSLLYCIIISSLSIFLITVSLLFCTIFLFLHIPSFWFKISVMFYLLISSQSLKISFSQCVSYLLFLSSLSLRALWFQTLQSSVVFQVESVFSCPPLARPTEHIVWWWCNADCCDCCC